MSNATYASHGPVKRMQLGGLDRYYQIGFNSRLQTTSIQFGTNASPSAYLALTYGYGTTTNNGKVLSQSINAAGTNSVPVYEPVGMKSRHVPEAILCGGSR